MVKRELTVGGLICHLASEMHFHSQKKIEWSTFLDYKNVPLCNFFLEYDPRFSVAPFQLCPIRNPQEDNDQSTFTFLTKRIAAVLRFRTTRVRVPLARNPSPLQYRTLRVQTKLCSIFATPTKICTRGWSIWGSRHQLRSHPHTTSTSGTLYFLKVFPRPPKE